MAFGGLVGVTLGLIVLGALVRAHGAGLACPDWPLCFGELVPRFDFRVAYEWSHRVLASIVSCGLVALSLLLYTRPRLWRRVRGPLFLAFGLLAMQVTLGGLTVLFKLAPWTVTAHLIVGLSFCATLLWISRDLLESPRALVRQPVSAAIFVAGLLSGVLLLLQIVLGGMVSSQYAGLACTSFPTCDGSSVVPSLSGQVGLHVMHRLNAVALFGALASFAWLSRAHARVHRIAFLMLRLVLAQIGIGVLNVLVELSVEVTALHTAVAASLVLSLSLALRELVRSRALDAVGVAAGTELEAPQVA